jgi:uncharacterized membrane protein
MTLGGYLQNPWAEFAMYGASLLSILFVYGSLGNLMIAVLVALVEACVLLIVSWLRWRAWRRDKSAGKSQTKRPN